jgi:hypothetical protein
MLDAIHSTLNIPVAMGFTQCFPVALALPHPSLPNDNGSITNTFRQVMFAALRACVRRAFIGTSLDSPPLFKTMLEMDTIYLYWIFATIANYDCSSYLIWLTPNGLSFGYHTDQLEQTGGSDLSIVAP